MQASKVKHSSSRTAVPFSCRKKRGGNLPKLPRQSLVVQFQYGTLRCQSTVHLHPQKSHPESLLNCFKSFKQVKDQASSEFGMDINKGCHS